MWRGPTLPPYQVASWSIQPFGHNTPTSQTGHYRQATVRWHRANRFSNGRQNVYQKIPPQFWQKYLPLFFPRRILLRDYYRVDAPGTDRWTRLCLTSHTLIAGTRGDQLLLTRWPRSTFRRLFAKLNNVLCTTAVFFWQMKEGTGGKHDTWKELSQLAI